MPLPDAESGHLETYSFFVNRDKKLSNIHRIAVGNFPGQFTNETKRPAGINAKPINQSVDDHYSIFTQEALIMAQGDIQKADYLMDYS